MTGGSGTPVERDAGDPDVERVELVSDGEGVVVVGAAAAVEGFLRAAGLTDRAEPLAADLGALIGAVGAASHAAAAAQADSGRWVKLTPESAHLVKMFGLMPTKTPGIEYAMIGQPGNVSSWVQVEARSTSSLIDPSLMSGLAAAMAQLAQQHEMRRIRAHLERLDRKVDVVLRAQHDAEVARVVGAGADIASAMAVRAANGRIDAITWSTVQARTHTISDALSWALLRLDSVAGYLATAKGPGELERAAAETDGRVQELTSIIARCFELQDALDLLRLDRVIDATPDEVDGHRLALTSDRVDRRRRVTEMADRLLSRIDAATSEINAEVILHPRRVAAAVASLDSVNGRIYELELLLDILGTRQEATRVYWGDAIRNPAQLKRAGVEAGKAALVAGLIVGGFVVTAVVKESVTGSTETKT